MPEGGPALPWRPLSDLVTWDLLNGDTMSVLPEVWNDFEFNLGNLDGDGPHERREPDWGWLDEYVTQAVRVLRAFEYDPADPCPVMYKADPNTPRPLLLTVEEHRKESLAVLLAPRIPDSSPWSGKDLPKIGKGTKFAPFDVAHIMACVRSSFQLASEPKLEVKHGA